MLRLLTATSLLALTALPAMAQTETQPTTPSSDKAQHGNAHSATPATPATPATRATPRSGDEATVPATRATPATPATPAMDQPSVSEPTVPTGTTEPREVTVQKLVDAEFPTYDANNNGNLEPAEFSNWVLALYDASGDANAPKDAAAKAKWAKSAFATADTDKNKIVSKAEMNIFLIG
ncbi:EF-hand domain-containing protein [Sphingorhabdus sp.]|uniref:EF-hand domain-containing protein n=1 Tax=Sphingorhabdus sp. TaxID=1902408 RepID=UPI00391CFC55